MKFTISDDISLLDALSQAAPDCSTTTLRSWLKEGRVVVDGVVVKVAKTPARKGQSITIKPRSRRIGGDIQILYEDGDILVIDKPEGLLSVATAFEKSRTAHAILKKEFRPRRIFVVHRLDQDTSGVMLFALNEKAQEQLKKEFEKHTIERRYAAIVEGHFSNQSGIWQSYLYENSNYFVRSTANKEKGQLAITHYRVCGKSKSHTWLDLKLETGKKNQIRVHCQDAGHPVVGDKKYGARSNSVKRLYLHAYYLSFTHPKTNKRMLFDSSVPDAFLKIVKQKKRG